MARLFAQQRGVVAALESEEDQIANDTVVADVDSAGSPETALIDVNESATEGEAAEAEVADSVEAVASLESYLVSLEAAAGVGGLDRSGAQVLNIGLESVYSRVGFRKTKPSVSLESFGQNSSRAGATTLAMEDIKDKMREIWKAIVAAVKRAIAWVTDHYNKMFGAAQGLQKRAKALQEKAKGVSGTAKEKTFENERIAKALADSKGTVPAAPSAGLEAIKKCAAVAFSEIADFNAKTAEGALEELAKDVADGAAAIAEFEVSAPSGAAALKTVTDPKAAGFGEPHANMILIRSDELLGNKAMIGEVAAKDMKGEDAAKAIIQTSTFLGAFDPKAKPTSKTSVATLAQGECGKIGEEVESLMTEVINYKAKLSKATELQKKLAAAAEKLGKESTTETDKAKSQYMALAQKVTTAVVQNLNRAPAQLSAYILNVSKTALDYADLSLKQYSAAK